MRRIPVDGLSLFAGVSTKVPLGVIYLSLEAFLQFVSDNSETNQLCRRCSPVDPVLWLSVSRVPSKAGTPGADSPLERERLSTESSYTTSSSSSSESFSIGGGIMHRECEGAADVLSSVLFRGGSSIEGAF